MRVTLPFMNERVPVNWDTSIQVGGSTYVQQRLILVFFHTVLDQDYVTRYDE